MAACNKKEADVITEPTVQIAERLNQKVSSSGKKSIGA